MMELGSTAREKPEGKCNTGNVLPTAPDSINVTSTSTENQSQNQTIDDKDTESMIIRIAKVLIAVLSVLFMALILVTILSYIKIRKADFSGEIYIPTQWKKIWKSHRLPSFIVPNQYHLTLNPNLTDLVFHGKVNISFMVKNSTDFIVFHAAKLRVENLILSDGNDTEYKANKMKPYDDSQQIALKLSAHLKPNKTYTLKISFSGNLEKISGRFYRTFYKTSDGKSRYVALTNLQPTKARYLFPCFDEPAMKASFKLTVLHHINYSVFSNTEIESAITKEYPMVLTKFNITEKMSTHALAFVICNNYRYVEKIPHGTKLKIITLVEDNYNFTLESAINITDIYNKVFEIQYPLSKFDIIEIPVPSTESEGWGITTLGRESFTYNAENYSESYLDAETDMQSKILIDISEQVARQWFGYLVTVKWWNDLWMTEGLVYVFKDIILSKFDQSRQENHFSYAKRMILSLNDDVFEKAEPVYAESDKIISFDNSKYLVPSKKFACILWMFKESVGLKTFTKSIRKFLEEYKYRNANHKDLLGALTENGSDLNATKVLGPWIYQRGFPLISVARIGNLINLTQRCYTEDLHSKVKTCKNEWIIPVTYITQSNKSKRLFWLNETSGTISVTENDAWIKLNVDFDGFYRVVYSEKLLKNLIEELTDKSESFSAADRVNLLNDAYIFYKMSYLSLDSVSSLTAYMSRETEFLPWWTFIYNFKLIRKKLPTDKSQIELSLVFIFAVAYANLKPQQGYMSRKVRSFLQQSAKEIFNYTLKDRINNKKRNARVVRSVAYNTGVYRRKEDWEYKYEMYHLANNSSEARLLLNTMAQTGDHKRLQTTESSHILRLAMNIALRDINEKAQYDKLKSYIPLIKPGFFKQHFLYALDKIRNNIYKKNHVKSSEN